MKTQFYNAFKFITCFLFAAVLFTACKKDDNSPDPIVPTGSTIRTTVTGRVTSSDGNVIIGATIKLAGITTVSDNHGNFLFVNITTPASRMVLNASMTGYFNCVKGKKTQTGGVNYINIVMEPLPNASLISGMSGGVAAIPGGASITFPANAFVDASGNPYTGQVKVYATHLNTGNPNFEAMIPGGDLIAKNSAGQFQSLYSLGMIEAKLYDNTGLNEIKLASGKTAELKFPIDPSQNSAAQATIPMWYLNEITGIWQEEGEAIKTGNNFIGSVSHFSTWNCDYQGERTDISGKVVDCQNNPMPNVVVTINGFMNITTDNSGNYATWVPAGYLIECQVLLTYNPFINVNSPIQSITAIGGQINNIPVIIVPCASRIAGAVKTCTGALSPGFVYLNWNGGSAFYLSSTGLYDLYVPVSTYINIIGSTYSANGSTFVTSGVQGTSINAPDVVLCNVQIVGQTKFTVNTTGIGSVTYLISLTNSISNFTDQNSDGIFDIVDFTIDGTYTRSLDDVHMEFSITTASQVDNYYLLEGWGLTNYASIYIDSVGVYSSDTPPLLTNNHLIITDYGSPGGVMSGTFNYDTPTGSITEGEFSIIRND